MLYTKKARQAGLILVLLLLAGTVAAVKATPSDCLVWKGTPYATPVITQADVDSGKITFSVKPLEVKECLRQ